jgi:hypothetical protein
VTVLGDATKAYVASFQADAGGAVCTQATVIDTAPGTISASIPLAVGADNSAATGCSSARFRVFASVTQGGAGSNFKVFVSQCDAGSVAVIDTFASSTGTNQHPADVLEANIPLALGSLPATQVSISAASHSSTNTTYTYTLLSGPDLQTGQTIVVNGMSDAGNNGNFVISSVTPATFTVTNTTGVTTSAAQSGSGSVVPTQNPVFVTAAP